MWLTSCFRTTYKGVTNSVTKFGNLGNSYPILYTVLYCWVLVNQNALPPPSKPLKKSWFVCPHIKTANFSQLLVWLQTHSLCLSLALVSTVGLNINTGSWSEPNCWPEMFMEIPIKLNVYNYKRAHRHASCSPALLCRCYGAVMCNSHQSTNTS